MLEWQQHAQQMEAQVAECRADLSASQAAESTAVQVWLACALSDAPIFTRPPASTSSCNVADKHIQQASLPAVSAM